MELLRLKKEEARCQDHTCDQEDLISVVEFARSTTTNSNAFGKVIYQEFLPL
jgi:hypothetical protein